MANEGYDRTFPGDPNPPARPPAPATPAVEEPVETESAGSGPAPGTPVQQSRPARATFRVSADEDGAQSVYMTDDKLETTRLGSVSVGNADELLTALGEFNPKTGSWRIPEAAAKQLLSGDPPTPEYLSKRYSANKAMIVRGVNWTDWARGEKTLEEAQGLNDLEEIKMMVKDAPLFVWQGSAMKTIAKMWSDLKEAGLSGAARRAAGEVAAQAAITTDAPMAAAAGIAIIAPVIASKGAAAAAVVPAVAFMLEKGLVFKRSYEIEGGNAIGEMIDKGFDPETAKHYGPLVGVINGLLETVSFHAIPAAYKRVVARKVLAAPPIKAAVASAYKNYLKELGLEISTEVAQERVNVMAENLAADLEARPDLKVTGEQALNRYVNSGLAAAIATGGAKVPGLVLEVGAQRADAKAKAAREARVKEALAPAAQSTSEQGPSAAPVTPESAAAPVQAPATPVPVDPTGDYIPAAAKAVDTVTKTVEDTTSGAISPDESIAAIDKVLGEMDASPQNYSEKVLEVERKGRLEALRGDLLANQEQIDALTKEYARYERNGMGTKVIETRIDKLLEKNAQIRGDISVYDAMVPSRVGLETHETIALKPATLENIVQVGFKEGRKDVIATRSRQIKEIAAAAQLTNADIRLLLRDKNFGLMGDVEFRNFLNGFERMNPETKKTERVSGFREKVAAHVERKIALKDVRKTLKEKQIKGERNIRALHDLPTVGKMTTQQLFDYLDILSEYDEGAVALTPKRIKANETSKLKGAKTAQDVLRLASERVRVSAAEMLESRRGQFDMLRGDTELSESEPAYAFAVDEVQTEEALGEAAAQEFERQNYALGAAALASRAGLFSLRRLVPSMPEVMAHLEADPAQVYTGEVTLPEITPEEQKYVEFLRTFFAAAREYLFQTGELESTRFKDIYAPHTRRSWEEVLVGIKGAKDVRAALGEFFDNWLAYQKEVGGTDTGGPALSLRKFFKNTVFRTGEMTPSTNVLKATTSYAKQFFKKQALDRALPVVDGFVEALAAVDRDQSEEGQKAWAAVRTMVKTYLNNKKGINSAADAFAPRGGVVDLAIRGVSGWISLAYIAGNVALELSAPVGETMATIPLVGLRGMALANKRMLIDRAQANKIFEKYEFFVGKGALDMLTEPGKTPTERVGVVLYGLLQWGRTRTLKTVLMASMTDAEFKAGEISADRLAELRLTAGRWIDIHGLKSVAGSTSMGAAFTKFRGWMLPILRTTLLDDIPSFLKFPGTKPLTPRQTAELYRIVEASLIASVGFAALGGVDEDDDSFSGKLKKRVLAELFSLTQVFDPKSALTMGPVAGFVTQLGVNLSMLYHLETYKTGDREGELKALPALGKQLPFSGAFRNFTSKDKE